MRQGGRYKGDWDWIETGPESNHSFPSGINGYQTLSVRIECPGGCPSRYKLKYDRNVYEIDLADERRIKQEEAEHRSKVEENRSWRKAWIDANAADLGTCIAARATAALADWRAKNPGKKLKAETALYRAIHAAQPRLVFSDTEAGFRSAGVTVQSLEQRFRRNRRLELEACKWVGLDVTELQRLEVEYDQLIKQQTYQTPRSRIVCNWDQIRSSFA